MIAKSGTAARSMQQEQDGMERLDREIIDLPRKWRRGTQREEEESFSSGPSRPVAAALL